jgi:hypothetical protein
MNNYNNDKKDRTGIAGTKTRKMVPDMTFGAGSDTVTAEGAGEPGSPFSDLFDVIFRGNKWGEPKENLINLSLTFLLLSTFILIYINSFPKGYPKFSIL